MDLLIVPVPLFNKDMAVEAYYFRHQKGNEILETSRGTRELDGAMISAPLQMLNTVGIEAFTMGKPIVVPIDNFMLLAALELQCSAPADKIIFLVDGNVCTDPPYLANMDRLKEMGYRFAIQKISTLHPYEPILEKCDYIFYDFRRFDQKEYLLLHQEVSAKYDKLTKVYAHIGTMELFTSGREKLDGLYEGRFYRTPITKGEERKVSPLQVNQINLLNLVRDENFEFSDVAKIIQRDTALTINLLRLVNSPFLGLRNKVKDIGHAVAMLGQDEVRKWITTAVANLLASDKPSEITRLSLVRAKFCESAAPLFGLEKDSQGLFLMGLFSVLDVILNMPMDEALTMVRVSDSIYEALVNSQGPFFPVYNFLQKYESADWKTVSRQLILNDIAADDVYHSYTDALCWYRDLIDQTQP